MTVALLNFMVPREGKLRRIEVKSCGESGVKGQAFWMTELAPTLTDREADAFGAQGLLGMGQQVRRECVLT